MANMLRNPNLGDWRHVTYFHDKEGKSGTIEAPAEWEFVAKSLGDDPNKLPESIHRDDGFLISAVYRAWEGGYKQAGIALSAGQRYRAHVRFKPDVNFPGGQREDLTAITWRFVVVSDAGTLEQNWAMTGKDRFKHIETFDFVFDVAQATTASLTFWARSFYAGNKCDLFIYEISLEAIANNGIPAPVLGTPSNTEPDPADDPTILATEKIPRSELESLTGPSGKSLGDVLTVSEIDTIANGLRKMAVNAPDSDATLGLNTLADAIERLK
ncbi:MAG: hypothetical protein AAFQ52_01190 [Chloroflexota bacterium]